MFAKVYVEITNICNMSCSFCHGHSRAPRRMSKEEFCFVLDRLRGVTSHIYYHLMGEPLTHPELPDFIGEATARGFRSVITTNGTLLKKRAEELIASGVHKVSISLHSFEDGSNEAFDRYISEVIEFSEKASARGIIVVLRLWNRGLDGGKNDSIYDTLKARIRGEWAENTRGVRIHDKLHLEWGDRFVWPDKDAPLMREDCFCYGLNDHFGILCDGTVVPCCLDSDGVIALGNIFENGIDEILNSPRAQKIIEGFKSRRAAEDLCRRCSYAQRFK